MTFPPGAELEELPVDRGHEVRVAAPSLFSAGSRVVHAPAYPELSRTVIEPPDTAAPVAALLGVVVELAEGVAPEDDEPPSCPGSESGPGWPPQRGRRSALTLAGIHGIHLLVMDFFVGVCDNC